MTSKERARIAMAGGTPDCVPVIPQICPPHAFRVAGLPFRETVVDALRRPERYEMCVADCAAGYGVDGFRVWLAKQPQRIEWDGDEAYALDPETGERYGTVDFMGGGGIVRLDARKRALGDADIEAIHVPTVPEALASADLRPLRKAVAKYGSDMFVVGVPGVFTVETMIHVQGMERTLMDMLDRPEFVKAWSNRLLDATIPRAIAAAQLGADAFYVGETFGQFMSPQQFGELCLPYFQRFVEALRPHGPLIYLHMCGRITHLLDLILESGADGLEPLDTVAGTSPAAVRRHVGGRMALMGGVDTVMLSRGSVDQVRAESARCIREAGEDGGYLLAACDMLPTETDPDKVRAMLDVARAHAY